MRMRTHEWRDCQAWRDEGLPIGTASNEAAKLYDACLTQAVGWYDDPDVGGIVQSMQKMQEADSDFILGRAFNVGMRLAGTLQTTRNSEDLRKEFEILKSLADGHNTLSNREYLHVKAVEEWAKGKVSNAVGLWEEVLLEYPTDIHAFKMAYIGHFYLGDAQQLRDSPARILPVWEAKKPPLKSFLYGNYAFGLEEMNQYQQAEKFALKGLEGNSSDGWSTHALSHVFEMEGRTQEGIKYLTSSASKWDQNSFLACHNYWHLALYHLENEDYDNAINVFEQEVLARATKSRAMIDIADVTSLVCRLQMLSPHHVKDSHLEEAFSLAKEHSQDGISIFNDYHFCMAYAGCRKREKIDELIETLSSSFNNGDLSDHQAIALPLIQAIVDFMDEKYDQVVDSLEPIRYRLMSIGGSHAQRDVFNLMLIIACLKARDPMKKKLARVLIHEREAQKSTALVKKLHQLVH